MQQLELCQRPPPKKKTFLWREGLAPGSKGKAGGWLGPRIHSCAVSFLWGDTWGCRGSALSEGQGEVQDPSSSMQPQALSRVCCSVILCCCFCSTSDGPVPRGIRHTWRQPRASGGGAVPAILRYSNISSGGPHQSQLFQSQPVTFSSLPSKQLQQCIPTFRARRH